MSLLLMGAPTPFSPLSASYLKPNQWREKHSESFPAERKQSPGVPGRRSEEVFYGRHATAPAADWKFNK